MAGWWITFLALKEDAFSALAVKHLEGQKVIDSGIYSVVRHPMYTGGFLLFVGMPLWLESYAGVLLASVPCATLVVWRIRVEEEFLRRELPGEMPPVVGLRTSPRFVTIHYENLWLNRLFCFGVGEYRADTNEAKYDVFAVR